MTDWPAVWLGVIAISVAVMTTLQLVVWLAVMRVARQTGQALREFQREVQPLVEKAHRIADDAARTTALAAAQAERIDAFLRTTTDRVDETFGMVQSAIAGPLRQGSILIAVAKAAFAMFSASGRTSRNTRDDEDALFVG